MSNHTTRTKHVFVPGSNMTLEDRVLQSVFSHSRPLVPGGLVGGLVREHETAAAVRTVSSVLEKPIAIGSRHGMAPMDVAPTVKRWSWLANTYWFVPPMNLPAVLYDSSTGTLVPVSDQTVFHITSYANGYFWGQSVTQLGSSAPSNSKMVGSVTPEGKVLLTFTATSTNSSPTITEGFGVMTRKFGQWTMENQMFTSPSETLQIGHWAYMLQTHPGLPSWNSLPSAGVSVPQFLSE